jgi:hypothetical protein
LSARPVVVAPGVRALKEREIITSCTPLFGGIVKTDEPPVREAKFWTYFVFTVVGQHCFFDVSWS